MRTKATWWVGLPLLLASCAGASPAPVPPSPPGSKLEPAPLPHGPHARRGGTVGSLEVPLPPKMPLGTGTVPVGSGPVRGSVVTGFRESF